MKKMHQSVFTNYAGSSKPFKIPNSKTDKRILKSVYLCRISCCVTWGRVGASRDGLNHYEYHFCEQKITFYFLYSLPCKSIVFVILCCCKSRVWLWKQTLVRELTPLKIRRSQSIFFVAFFLSPVAL